MIFSHRKIHGLRKCSKEKKGGDWDRMDGNGLKGWLDFSCSRLGDSLEVDTWH